METVEFKNAIDTLGRNLKEFQAENDRRLEKIEKGMANDTLSEEKLQKLNESMDATQKQIEEMKAAYQRGTAAQGEGSKEEKAAFVKEAFNMLYKKGDHRLSDEQKQAIAESYGPEYKALSTSDDSEGGYLVRPEVDNNVRKKLFESSPMRQLASVQVISSDALEFPFDDDEPGSGWVGENATRAATDANEMKLIRIPAHELYARPVARQRLLDDAAIDIEAWHAQKVAEKFARDEETAFVAGNGVNKPRGILSYASGTAFDQIEQVISGDATTVTADGLIDLQNALFEPLQANATFLMKRATAGAIRKLKDGSGNYLWREALTGGLLEGMQGMLLGKPVRFADDMQALGAGNLPVAYGDFRQGYLIVDRIGMRVLRDPYSTKGSVEFYTTKRVGGGVQHYQAIKLLVCSAS